MHCINESCDRKRRGFFRVILISFLLVCRLSAGAWVYFEHRGIALLAIQNLSPEDRTLLQKLWAEARVGFEGRLSGSVILVNQGRNPTQLDYAFWSAIAGDHSPSASDLLKTVLHSEWILKVADVSAELRIAIEN